MAGGTRGTIQSVEDCVARVGQVEDRWVEYQRNMETYMQQMNQHIAESKQQFAKSDKAALTVSTILADITQRLADIEANSQRGPTGRDLPNGRAHTMGREPPLEREFHGGREPHYVDDEDDYFPRGRERDQYVHHGQPSTRQNSTNSHVRMEMPNFNGENPRAWLYKVERYFRFYDFDDEQKFILASVHLDGPALTWFESVESTNQLHSWAQFRTMVTQRFGPSPFQDLHGDLAKLQQYSTVKQFFSEFEELTNQLPGIPEQALQSYFVSGLRPEIRQEVRTLQPKSLVHSFQLARMIEDRLTYTADQTVRRPTRQPYQPPQVQPGLLPAPPRAQPSIAEPTSFVQLTPAQMTDRKAKGLCFNCPEKFYKGHVCKAQSFMIYATNEHYDGFDLEDKVNLGDGSNDTNSGIDYNRRGKPPD